MDKSEPLRERERKRALGSFVRLHGKTSKIRPMDQSWSKGLHLSDEFLSVPLPWSIVPRFGSDTARKEVGVKQPVISAYWMSEGRSVW